MPNRENMLDTAAAAELIKVSPATLRSYAYLRGRGASAYANMPEPEHVGRALLWPAEELLAWHEARPIAGARHGRG